MRLKMDTDFQEISQGAVLKAGETVVGEGARYLGYGVMKTFSSKEKGTNSGQLMRFMRSCILAPCSFTVLMRCHGLKDETQKDTEQLELLQNALIALGTIGGMGAKSRKGYGSLAIQTLSVDGEEQHLPKSISELSETIKKLRHVDKDKDIEKLPEFTAFSSKSRHVLLSSEKKEPIELLDLVGRELVRFRSWGRNGKILGNTVDSEKNFKCDHDLMKSLQKHHPLRIAFGLPHGPIKPKDFNRRASPLFIHIHQCGDDMPVAVLSFLPALFLPKDKKSDISYISVGKTKVPQLPEEELYKPIHNFLDRLLDTKKCKELFKCKEPFTKRLKVCP